MTGPVVMDYRGDRLMDYQVLFLACDSNKFDRYMKIPLTKAARNITACVKWLVYTSLFLNRLRVFSAFWVSSNYSGVYFGSVRSTTGCLPVSERVKSFRLRFLGHLARLNPEEGHHRVIAAALRPPSDWRRPAGRPRTTWLRTIGDDLQSQNFGVRTAWRKAKERYT